MALYQNLTDCPKVDHHIEGTPQGESVDKPENTPAD